MIAKLLPIALLLGAVAQLGAQSLSRPNVPEKINAPANEQVVLKAQGSGSQIYVCHAGTDGKLAWSLKAPEAELLDAQGAVIGRHYAGPTWEDKDGSAIVGQAVAKVVPPDLASIPWLLVNVTRHSGDGVLSRVTSVQRINTQGGMPPPETDCNTSKLNSEMKSRYTADYYFYAPAK